MRKPKRHFVIVNPISGRGAGRTAVDLIKTKLAEHGVDYSLQQTERPWHAAALTQEAIAKGYDAVLAAGGDGTANEVLNGIMLARDRGEGSAIMGILPVGSGNDFSFGAGVQPGLEQALQDVLDARRVTIDVGRVTGGLYPEGRYFGNGVGIGFDAVVGFEALKLKRLRGFPAYAVAAIKTISLYYQAPKLEIKLDGETMVQSCLMVSIMNGRRMGGGFMMAPQSHINDGILDLCIVRQVSRARMLSLIMQFMQGTQGSSEAVSMHRADRVSVRALEGSLPAHADGETLCTEGDALSMEILPAQLEVFGRDQEGHV